LKDPLLDKFFRKKVTLVQLGTQPVLLKPPEGEKEWTSEDFSDFTIFISKHIFEKDEWSSYVSSGVRFPNLYVDCMTI